MATNGQLDRVCNRLTAGQRRAHALMPHGDAVRHGDRGCARRTVVADDDGVGQKLAGQNRVPEPPAMMTA